MSKGTKASGVARDLPWAALLQAALLLARRWEQLSEKDRERVRSIVRESRGRLHELSQRERRELRKLAGKLDLAGIGSELLPLVRRTLAARGGRSPRA